MPKTMRGFTLIELVIVIGILGILASTILIFLRPQKDLLAAQDAKRRAAADSLEKGFVQYLIDKWEMPGGSKIKEGAANGMPICRKGVVDDDKCINVDAMSSYVSDIPVDIAEPCAHYTGFSVYTANSRVHVTAVHLGTFTAEPTDDCETAVVVTTDTDDDGIDNTVDTAPSSVGNDFSDGGTTGTIVNHGDQKITIVDAVAPSDGVLIGADASGGAVPATISVNGGAATLTLTPGDAVIVTVGSVIVNVQSGTVDAAFAGDHADGATGSIPAGNTLTFRPDVFTFAAASSNTHTLTVVMNAVSRSVAPGATVGDTSAPVLSSVTASSVTGVSATITWTTDKQSDSQVEYGTTTGYGMSTTLGSTRVTSHSQILTGLTSGTLYHYRVKSKDVYGNLATSSDATFTTLDVTAPIISAVAANPGNTTATVTWTTNEASNTVVEYGTTTAYGSSVQNGSLVTSHSKVANGLSRHTLYHYRVKSTDAAGNLATSGDSTFTTH